MTAKHHCLICTSLIYSGMYCSGCYREILRTRTTDDESFEEWLSRKREFRISFERMSVSNNSQLEDFFKA
ncbi:MAG TPA: hypothetical protein VJ944_00130 [Thermoplasmataceae archaeon]|nr:hypothetical protein [Thermoplasmataceae archaeon]